jgi:hypothetical protein
MFVYGRDYIEGQNRQAAASSIAFATTSLNLESTKSKVADTQRQLDKCADTARRLAKYSDVQQQEAVAAADLLKAYSQYYDHHAITYDSFLRVLIYDAGLVNSLSGQLNELSSKDWYCTGAQL